MLGGACGADDAAPVPAHPNGPGADGGARGDGEPLAAGGTGADPEAADMHARADAAVATMMLRYWEQLRTQSNDAYWTYAHDFDVVLDAVERRGPAAYHGAVRMFFDVQDARGWTRDFYDDENWMVLTVVHAYDLTGEQAYLDRGFRSRRGRTPCRSSSTRGRGATGT